MDKKVEDLKKTSSKLDISISQTHYKIKSIINKMVDRLKPEVEQFDLTLFDIVIQLSEYLGVEPGEIYKQLNTKNRNLCDAQASIMSPSLANEKIKENGFENLLD